MMHEFLPVIAALAWLVLPGRALLAALGARVPMPVVLGVPLTFGMLLLLSGAFDLIGVHWAPLPCAIGCALLVGVALGVRLLAKRSPSSGSGGEHSVPDKPHQLAHCENLIIHLGAVLGASAVIVPALRGMKSLDALNGSYDGFFHYAALSYIRREGSAFPFSALSPMYGGEPTYYPTSWHMLASLIPGDAITSANAVVLLSLGLFPAGCVLLLHTVLPTGADLRTRAAIAAAGGGAGAAFLSLPVMALVFGLWPYVLATAILPILVAAAAQLLLRLRPGARPRRSTDIIALAAVMAGALSIHPSGMFSAGVIGVLTALALGMRMVTASEPKQRRLGLVMLCGSMLCALLGVGVAVLKLAPMAQLTRQENGTWLSLALVTLLDRPRVRSIPLDAAPLALLLLLAAAGVVAVLWRRDVAGLVAIGVGAAALVLTASTQSEHAVLRAMSAPWYGARERLHVLVELAMISLAATAALTAVTLIAGRSRFWRRLVAVLAVSGLSAPIAVAAVSGDRAALAGQLGYGHDDSHLTSYVTERERAFIEDSAASMQEDSIVIGDPRDGTTMYLVLGGVNVVYPQLDGAPDTDARRLARAIDIYDEAPTVCESYRVLGEPEFFYQDTSPHNGDFFRSAEDNAMWDGLRELGDDRAVLTEVDRDGPYVLYRLDLPCD